MLKFHQTEIVYRSGHPKHLRHVIQVAEGGLALTRRIKWPNCPGIKLNTLSLYCSLSSPSSSVTRPLEVSPKLPPK